MKPSISNVVQRHKQAKKGNWRKHIPADLTKGFQAQVDALENVLGEFSELMKKAGGKYLDDAYKKQENLKKQLASKHPNWNALSEREQDDYYYSSQDFVDLMNAVAFLEYFYSTRPKDHKVYQSIDDALDHMKDLAILRF